MHVHPILLMSAHGRVLQAGVAGQLAIVGLYNNSALQYYLRIWDIVSQSAPSGLQFGIVQGISGTVQTAITEHFIGPDRQVVGQMTAQSNTTGIGTNIKYLWSAPNSMSSGWIHDFPFCAVPPNHTALFEANTVAAALDLSLWWDWAEPGEWIQDWQPSALSSLINAPR